MESPENAVATFVTIITELWPIQSSLALDLFDPKNILVKNCVGRATEITHLDVAKLVPIHPGVTMLLLLVYIEEQGLHKNVKLILRYTLSD